MLHFLEFLFILIIAVVIIGFIFVVSIVRSILGLGRQKPSAQDVRRDYTFHRDNWQPHTPNGTTDSIRPEEGEIHIKHKERIFSKDDGEYVDYEEIKE